MAIVVTTNLIGKKWKGFALYPFIFIRPEYEGDKILLNHEKIHLEQQKELWVVGFYPWYLWETIRHGYNHNAFEVEAYFYQHKLDYLEERPRFNFKKWLK